MPTLTMTWQSVACCAALLLAGGVACIRIGARRQRRFVAGAGRFVRELGIVFALFALWELAGTWSVVGIGDAVQRGQDVWQLERTLHLPSEISMQNVVLPHGWLLQLCNLYYATMHAGVLVVFLVWVFLRHRDAYPRVRAVLVLLTGASLLVQIMPFAPPRLLPAGGPGGGMVDTAQLYGQSVYAAAGSIADQYSAMPSVHIAWASLVAVAVAWICRRGGWSRTGIVLTVLAGLHLAATFWVIIVTANHYWLDGAAAIGILAVVIGVEYAAREVWLHVWPRRVPDTAPEAARESVTS